MGVRVTGAKEVREGSSSCRSTLLTTSNELSAMILRALMTQDGQS